MGFWADAISDFVPKQKNITIMLIPYPQLSPRGCQRINFASKNMMKGSIRKVLGRKGRNPSPVGLRPRDDLDINRPAQRHERNKQATYLLRHQIIGYFYLCGQILTAVELRETDEDEKPILKEEITDAQKALLRLNLKKLFNDDEKDEIYALLHPEEDFLGRLIIHMSRGPTQEEVRRFFDRVILPAIENERH